MKLAVIVGVVVVALGAGAASYAYYPTAMASTAATIDHA